MKTALIHTFKLTLKPPAPMSDCGRARRGSYAGSASGKTASAYFASAEKTQAIQSPAECYVVSVLARLIHVLCALLIRLSTMRRRTPEPHPAPTRCFRSSADTSRNQGISVPDLRLKSIKKTPQGWLFFLRAAVHLCKRPADHAGGRRVRMSLRSNKLPGEKAVRTLQRENILPESFYSADEPCIMVCRFPVPKDPLPSP